MKISILRYFFTQLAFSLLGEVPLELQGEGFRGAKLDFQYSAHLVIHSLEGVAGISAWSPDPVEAGEIHQNGSETW